MPAIITNLWFDCEALEARTEAEDAVQETLRVQRWVERSGRGLSLGCEGAPAGTRT